MYLQATTTYGSLIPGSEYIRSLVRQGTISPEAAKKLRWIEYYYRNQNARLTCRYFGISPRFKNQFEEECKAEKIPLFYYRQWKRDSRQNALPM